MAELAVERVKSRDARPVGGEQRLGAVEVPQPFFTGVGDDQQPLSKLALTPRQMTGGNHQVDEVGGVVADAGRVEFAVFLAHGQRRRVGKNDVGMRCEDDQIAALRPEFADHVLGSVDLHVLEPLRLEPFADEGRAPAFVVRRRRDLSQRAQQVLGLFYVLTGELFGRGFDHVVHDGLPLYKSSLNGRSFKKLVSS